METKLVLKIEKEVVQVIREYAKEKGQSLSDLVENYFKLLANNREPLQEKELSVRIRKLRGIIKTDESLDYKELLEEELLKKYEE